MSYRQLLRRRPAQRLRSARDGDWLGIGGEPDAVRYAQIQLSL